MKKENPLYKKYKVKVVERSHLTGFYYHEVVVNCICIHMTALYPDPEFSRHVADEEAMNYIALKEKHAKKGKRK